MVLGFYSGNATGCAAACFSTLVVSHRVAIGFRGQVRGRAAGRYGRPDVRPSCACMRLHCATGHGSFEAFFSGLMVKIPAGAHWLAVGDDPQRSSLISDISCAFG